MKPVDKSRLLFVLSAMLVPALSIAQEGGSVEWEPRFDSSPPAWQGGLFLSILLVYAYGYWRCWRWLVNRYRGSRYWSRARVLWPVVMLCLSALCIPAGRLGGLALVPLLAVTFPSFLPMLLVASLGLEGWGAWLVGAALVWPTWYGLIRFTEWRLDVTRPVSLRIA